jgi:hypothetical protein
MFNLMPDNGTRSWKAVQGSLAYSRLDHYADNELPLKNQGSIFRRKNRDLECLGCS